MSDIELSKFSIYSRPLVNCRACHNGADLKLAQASPWCGLCGRCTEALWYTRVCNAFLDKGTAGPLTLTHDDP